MRVATAAFFAVLAVSAMATKLNEDAMLESFAEMQNSELGSFIYSLVSLQKSVKGGFYAPLFTALDNLKHNVEQQQVAENNLFIKQTIHHKNLMAGFEKDAANARSVITKETNLLENKLYPALKTAISLIAKAKNIISTSQAALAAAIKLRNERHAVYVKSKADLEASIAAIDAALPVLNGLKAGKSGLFLETNRNAIQDAQQSMMNSFAQVDSLYTVIPEVINNFLQKNFVDQAMLNEIINKLHALRNRFATHLSKIIQLEAVQVAAFLKKKASLEKTIADAQHLLAVNQAAKARLLKEIAAAKKTLADAREALQDALANIAKEKAHWAKTVQHHKDTVAELAKELAIVNLCYQKLNEHGITRTAPQP